MRKLLFLLIVPTLGFSRVPDIVNLSIPPKRIIRTCCAFGVDVKMAAVPFVKFTEITSVSDLGEHKYLGSKNEKNGIIYTKNGGFIDMGHLRDIADYTAYLFTLIKENRNDGLKDFRLGKEGGVKLLNVNIPQDFTDVDIANLAGKIAYDLSVWHEISTWYGASYIPLVPERYSSFSMEDAYSNLLGVHLGIKSILSQNSYESEMTKNISATLQHLGAVKTIEDTRDAMNSVKDIWWSGTAKLPSRKVLIKRQFNILDKVTPWRINENAEMPEYDLLVPGSGVGERPINDYYTLDIKANFKIPVRKVFGEPARIRVLTQDDFQALIAYAEIIANEEAAKLPSRTNAFISE